MRKQVRSIVAVATLGLLAASYQMGTAAETGLLIGAPAPATDTSGSATPTPANSGSATPTPANSANPTPVASASATPTAGATAGATPAPAATKTAAPTATKTATPTKAPVAAASTQTGAAINYKYGTVQLAVTKSSGKITDVTVLVGYGSGPEYNSVIAALPAYAVSANGSNFGNVSRATFSTTAFKQALDSALAKF